MKGKLFLLFAIMAIGLSNVWAYRFSAIAPSGQTLYYDVVSYTNHTCSVTYQNSSSPRYTNLTGALEIPSSVIYDGNTYSVTSIGTYAFSGCNGLTSVTIPNSVTSIGTYAFSSCNSLTSVTIPNSVFFIEHHAFYSCSNLTSATIGSSVADIGSYVFFRCSNLTSVIVADGNTYYDSRDNCNAIIETYSNTLIVGCRNTVIPNSVTSIGSSAFSACSDLTSVTIPNSVTSIGNNAFEACNGLASVTIPNSVTTIGSSAFSGCSGLVSVTIPNSVASIGDYAFYHCSSLTSVTIPNSVTSIGNNAFVGISVVKYCGSATGSSWGATRAGCFYEEGDFIFEDDTKTAILAYIGTGTSVTIPNSVTSIGNHAFDGSNNVDTLYYNARNLITTSDWHNNSVDTYGFRSMGLNHLVIGDSVQTLPAGVFYGQNSLTSVTIPNSVISIEPRAFSRCSGLTSVTIPNSVTSIGYGAFEYCSGLTSVTIGNSVTSIGNSAFYFCTGLTSVNISNSVTSIGNSAFYYCRSLNNVIMGNSVTSIGNSAFYECYALTSIIIPNSVTSIGGRAFCQCYRLQSVEFNATYCTTMGSFSEPVFQQCDGIISLTIGDNVTIIPAWAFYECTNITNVSIPNSVTSIGNNAFNECSGLTSVTIPNSITSIGVGAFSGCSSLATVYDHSNLPITRGSSNYGGVARNATKVVKVLTDDRGNFKAESQYSVDSIYYTRSYEQGNRSTLCLPFKPAAVSPSGIIKYYEASSFDGSTITFNEVAFENLEANKPYMVEWPASKTPQEFKFSAGATTIIESRTADTTVDLGNNGSFIGTMTRTCMNSSNYGYKNGYFVQSADGTQEEPADHAHVNPFRAYFQITPSNAQGFTMPTEISVRFNTAEDNVGIDSVEPQQSNIHYSNDVYDMMGRMVRKNAENLDGLRKGVYIWKGEKKVVF